MDNNVSVGNLSNVAGNVASVLSTVSKVELDPHEFDGLEPEQAIIDWYTERFDRAEEDNMPYVINCYLERLQKDQVNSYTRALILRDAMSRIVKMI